MENGEEEVLNGGRGKDKQSAIAMEMSFAEQNRHLGRGRKL